MPARGQRRFNALTHLISARARERYSHGFNMPSNDFLSFAGGSGANVLSQADYAALTAILSNGFSSGVAQSAQVNKVLRQTSIMATVLAQFAVDLTGSNAVDDGTTATLLAMLKSAVSAQSVGVVGTSRNAKMAIATASASATFTADEVILETVLGGLRYCLANVSDTFNLATDMDTGSAPVSGYVALYKLYNPATGASIRRIVNATSAVAPEIYAGAAPPAGYTASALVSVRPTNASGQFVAGLQRGRHVNISQVQVLNTSTPQALPTALSIAGAVPRNAKTASGSYAITNSAANGGTSAYIAGDSAWAGQIFGSITTPVGGNGVADGFSALDMDVPQTLYYTLSGTGGTATLIIWISGYTF